MDQQEYQQLMSELNYYQDLLEQVETSMTNLKNTKKSLEDFEKETSNIVLAPIANGVFVEAEIKNKDLFVNVGSNIVSKKSVKEAIKIIEEQEKEIISDKDRVIKKINECHVLLQNKGE